MGVNDGAVSRMDHPLRYLLGVLAAAALTFGSGVVLAQAVPLPVPISIAPSAAVSTGLQSTVTFDARHLGSTTAANAGYYSRPVLVTNNTLAGLAKGLAKRTAPSLAFMAAVAAAGWVIDELTDQVNASPQSGGAPIAQGSTYYVFQGNKYFSSREAMGAFVLSYHNQQMPGYPATHIEYSDSGNPGSITMYARPWASSYSGSRNLNAPAGLAEPVQAAVPATNTQLADLIKNNPSTWNDALHNPDGSVNRNPDVQAAAQTLANALNNPDPAQQPSPTQEWDTGQQGGDPAPAAGGDLEFPEFCSWAAVVCDFVAWFQEEDTEEPPVDLPFEEVPVEASEWNAGLGNGSCPSPQSIGLSMTTLELSYGPACDLAGFARPLVILSALLVGAFIVVGRQG